jgi:hypothetical protein
MKPHKLGLLVPLAFLGATCFAELEFSGYITLSGKSKFILTDTVKKKPSAWLDLGRSFEDHVLVAFDAKTEVLSLRKAERIVQLPLKLPQLRDGRERLAEFRAFFSQPGTLTANEVEQRFGPPPRYSQLLLEDEEKDVKREHSWWYYPLGPDTRVGIQIDQGRVQGVYHFYPKESGGLATEIIRKP